MIIIGVYWKGLVTLPLLMDEAQNFVSFIILMCFLETDINCEIEGCYDVIMTLW